MGWMWEPLLTICSIHWARFDVQQDPNQISLLLYLSIQSVMSKFACFVLKQASRSCWTWLCWGPRLCGGARCIACIPQRGLGGSWYSPRGRTRRYVRGESSMFQWIGHLIQWKSMLNETTKLPELRIEQSTAVTNKDGVNVRTSYHL